MKAIAFIGEGKVGFIEMEKPTLKPGHALVKITRSALCGSDMGPGNATYLAKREAPVAIGHESLGEVAESADPRFRPGQRVAILIVKGCGDCPMCAIGEYTLCGRPEAIRNANAEYVNVPFGNLIPLPDDISYEMGLLGFGCGIGVALGGVRKVDFAPGGPVGVTGVGPIGLCVVEVLRQKGASAIAIDTNRARLETAAKLGAAETLHPETDVARLKALAIKSFIHCCASDQALVATLDVIAKQGKIALLGAPSLKDVKTFSRLIVNEITITGSWHYGMGDVDEIVALLRGLRHPELMVTDVFPLTRCQEAYDLFSTGNCGKVLIDWERKD